MKGSLGAKDRNIEHAEKYVIGESYSGVRDTMVDKKVIQLELKIAKMVTRHGGSCSDVTSLVGAAMLAFSNGSKPRNLAATSYQQIVSTNVTEDKTPNLWRLAQAHRLFLVVLSQNECALTSTFRGIAENMENIELSLATIIEKLDQLSTS
jgi:hypothetical protein